jgi:AcrR family transcriptional regulator
MARLRAPQRREQLIEVATRVFARCGYDAATTAAIAQGAGVTEPILYRHFAGKRELFLTIVRAASQRIVERLRQTADRARRPSRKIGAIGREFPQHVSELQDAYEVIHSALAAGRDKKILWAVKEHYCEIERFFRNIIADGQKSGEFRRNLDPQTPTWQLINASMGYAISALELQQAEQFSIRAAVGFILDGLKA